MAGRSCVGLAACFLLIFGQATALGPTPAPAPAPGPSSAYGCYTPLNILEASGQHSTLLALLDSTNLTAILDSPDRTVTLLAPTDAGIAKTLQGLGGTLNGLERSSAVYPILQYHILPSPVMFSAFQDGNSFNTQLRVGRNTQTITINRTRDHVTVEGAFSTTNITSTGTSACGSMVYPLDGLLVPAISLNFLSSSPGGARKL